MVSDSGSRYAMLVSLLAHAALLVAAPPVVSAREMQEPPLGAGTMQPLDRGGGDTFEIDGLVDGDPGKGDTAVGVEVPDDGEAEVPQAPQPEPEPAPSPAVAPPAPAPRAPSTAAEEPTGSDAAPRPTAAPASAADGAPANGDEAAQRGHGGEADAGATGAHGKSDGRGKRYGDASALRGVGNISADFARAIPAAVSADRAWSRLPLGAAGTVEVSARLDGDGKLVEHHLSADAPRHLERLVKRTIALLQAGRFALTSAPGLAGRERLRIEVTLSQREPLDHPGDDPHHALNLGHDPPTASEPGKAYFTLASGRHFEARVTIVSSDADAAADEPAPAAPPPDAPPPDAPPPDALPPDASAGHAEP